MCGFTLDTDFFRAMEQPDVLSADVKVRLQIDHKNGVYYCRFTGEGVMEIPCDRCLEAMQHTVAFDEALTIKYGPEYDDGTDGVLVVPEESAGLDIAPLLSDMAMLTIPMRHVHASGGCNPAMQQLLHEHTGAGDSAEEADEE